MGSRVCEATNTEAIDESVFISSNSINWDAHRIGWVIAGSMAILTTIISFFNVVMHARYYHRPSQQRQIIRIILMPVVYAIISFFSYRFFRSYTYYSLVETVYEAFAIAAFLFLLVQYIGETPASQRAILAQSPKRSVPFPFCCWRYRPSKPYFLHTIKWLVVQYCIFRPLISIVAIICHSRGVLCPTQYSIHFAQAYLEAFDFITFSLALYGLIGFYNVTRVQLKGKSPLAKFLTIKGIVFFTFYQGFLFSILEKHEIIHGTQYWTSTNVSQGLQALATTIEMVLFSIVMLFSFSWKPYKGLDNKTKTNILKSFIHSQNYRDFFDATISSLCFFWDYTRGKPYTSSSTSKLPTGLDFDQAYDYSNNQHETTENNKSKNELSAYSTEKLSA
ncbi:organic solute transporter Ostalpha-domain-containing protein [Phakopsora pachyrhizi]|nr:organic solute transporter Ostalpha-domain-containing protein [Phakopsora pachyrhizi]